MESILEMVSFLSIGTRFDLKSVAVQHILDITGTEVGRQTLLQQPKCCSALVALIRAGSPPSFAKPATLALVNLSADEPGARTLLDGCSNLVPTLLELVLDPGSPIADPASMVLSNLSRPSCLVDRVVAGLGEAAVTVDRLVDVCANTGYNTTGAHLHYLMPFLSNLCQSVGIRRHLLDRERNLIHRLLPFTEYTSSVIRRGGIAGLLHNCCFETESHLWLLSPAVDLLPRLLLPLAGPEEFDDEDNDQLPLELQYLPSDKKREEDPDIRKMLLETLQQLCGTRETREVLRKNNTYLIMRELHKVEKDRQVLLCCENVVDILIRTEDEIGVDNLQAMDIPEDLTEKFTKMDEDFINDS